MGLYSRWMKRLIMSQVLEVERIVLEMSLENRRLFMPESGSEA